MSSSLRSSVDSGRYFLPLLRFIDIGIAQNAMFDAAPPPWARWLPAHGAVRVLMDATFTPSFDAAPSLALAPGWIVALTGTAFMTFRHSMRV